MELKEKLIALRKKNGLSQLEVSDELSVSRQAVSKWEVGDTTPSTHNLKCLAKLYGVPLEYLIDNEQDQSPEEYTNKVKVSADALAKEEYTRKVYGQRWEKLVILALVLCSIIAAGLVCIKISKRPGDYQSTIPIEKTEEVRIEPSGSFDLEW